MPPPGTFLSRICWTRVRMHVRMSPFSRYSSSTVIMCTITCIPNALLSCLPQSKQLRSFARLQPFFFIRAAKCNFFWRNGFLCKPMQLQAIWCGFAKIYAKPLNMTGLSCLPTGSSFVVCMLKQMRVSTLYSFRTGV